MMTLRARALGMTHTTFRNASGLPDWGQVTTARDLAILARHLIQDFPNYYHYLQHAVFPVPRPDGAQPPAHAADLSGRGRDEDRLYRGVGLQRRDLGRARRRAPDRRGAGRRERRRAGPAHGRRCSTRGSSGWACRRSRSRARSRAHIVCRCSARPRPRRCRRAPSRCRWRRPGRSRPRLRPALRGVPGRARAGLRICAGRPRRCGRRSRRGAPAADAYAGRAAAGTPAARPQRDADRASAGLEPVPELSRLRTLSTGRAAPSAETSPLRAGQACAFWTLDFREDRRPDGRRAATRDGSRSTRRRISPACARPAAWPPRRWTS